MFKGFSFKSFTKEEKKEIKENKEAIRLSTEAAAQALHNCITSDTFIKYRKELEDSGNALIEVGIDIMKKVRDNNERLALYDMLFVRADVLSLLLKSIIKDKL